MTIHRLAAAYPAPETTFADSEERCRCATCRRLDKCHAGEGRQLRLRRIPDAPAGATAGASAAGHDAPRYLQLTETQHA